MSNLQNLCRNCGRDLGNDQQSLAWGACSGRCAKALAPKVVSCGVFFLAPDTRAVCCLSPGHIGSHKDVHGFMWTDRAAHAAWNNITIRQQGKVRNFPNGPVPAGKYLSAEELAEMAGEGGNADASLGRAVDSVEKAVRGYHDMVRTVDSEIANEMLGRSVPTPKTTAQIKGEQIHKAIEERMNTETKRICACCPKVIGHANPHAVFCSSMCAEKAAEAYMSRPRTTVINTPPQMFVAAERALSFVAGLNLQDHSVKEQRESLEVVRALQTALRPERMKFEGTMGRLRDEEARQKSVREEKDREKKARFLQNLTKPTCFGTK